MTGHTEQHEAGELAEAIQIGREREVQMIGAAISLRDWHGVETAYNQLRDRIDRALIAHRLRTPPTPAPDSEALAWTDIARPPVDGDRILLMWDDSDELDPHVELGWIKRGIAYNTYGKPFSGLPTDWMPLPGPSARAAPNTEPAGGSELDSYEKFDGVGPHSETIETRARIGESYLEAYESALTDPLIAGYTPADYPSELLLDLLERLREAQPAGGWQQEQAKRCSDCQPHDEPGENTRCADCPHLLQEERVNEAIEAARKIDEFIHTTPDCQRPDVWHLRTARLRKALAALTQPSGERPEAVS